MQRACKHLLCIYVSDLLHPPMQEHYSSAYQIRMAACKSLVIVGPNSTSEQFYIKTRQSMRKFHYDEWELDICGFSKSGIFLSFSLIVVYSTFRFVPVPTRLNNQIIILLTDLGI